MRKLFHITLLLLVAATMQGQPSWTKKATKSVFTLKTFADDGTLIGSSCGFFTGENGEGLSCFAPFKGASKAIVIDSQGKEHAVECLLGANDTYDVARFRVNIKKSAPLAIANGQQAIGTRLWLLPYRQASTAVEGTVRKAETFKNYHAYYTLALNMPEGSVGCPLMNEAGEVVGLMQQPSRENDTLSYAVGASYADSLSITGLSINDKTLRSTKIKKDLPQDVEQAVLALYLGQASMDSASYVQLVEDFIARFPNVPDGYVYRADMATAGKRFDAATKDMEQAIKVAEKKDEVHMTYSKLIYHKEIYMSDTPYEGWSLDKALEEAQAAERENPQAVYRHQQAVILYAQKKYDEAATIYKGLCNSELRSASLFYEASRCEAARNDTTAQLALLDSCVALFNQPYLKEAAPYLMARAQLLIDCGQYRKAVIDLNEYEKLMQATVNANFYYLRHRAEIGGKMYQPALNDIETAIKMEPQNDFYYSEKASLEIRVGLYDEAIATAKQCIETAPQQSDGYLFLGVALCLKGQKAEGVKQLEKARDMGDTQAQGLIDKYGK